MPETYIGSSNSPISGDLAAKIAEGGGGLAPVVAAMFQQAMSQLDVMGAPTEVKDAAITFQKALSDWIQASAKVVEKVSEKSAPAPATPEPAAPTSTPTT